jgi:heat shock protein HslJ
VRLDFHAPFVAATAILIGFSGCGGTNPYEGESLEGTQWVLSSGVSTSPEIVLTLGFDRGHAGGWTGCNAVGVEYETDGDSITLGRGVDSTEAACGETPEGTAEDTYLSLFYKVDGWRIANDELVLLSDGDDVLRYTPRNAEARALVERLGSAPE